MPTTNRILNRSIQKAGLKPTDTVLEIGPGTGNLTVRILEKSKKLIAIEFDPRMAAEVTKRVQGTPEQRKLEVMLGDAIKVSFAPAPKAGSCRHCGTLWWIAGGPACRELGFANSETQVEWVPFDVLISNTPYQISSPLVFKMLAMPKPPRQAILMFQLEFGQRLVAKPGDKLYGRLSVNANFWATCSNVMKVSKANFRPPPQVDSCVVRIVPKQGAERPTIAFEEFDGLLRVCFNRKNRTMRASWLGTKEVLQMLEKVAALVRSKIERALESTGLLEKRARSCDETDFLKLLSALNSEGIHFA
ncbi:rRNA adenine N(6)-Methyltransferase [Colletotrichum higginsianum]|nr:rRNA adenine N(6)-Methyltransferase [Colletotrichum higginsianum]